MMQPEERLESEAKLRLEVGDAAGACAAFMRLVGHSPEQWAYHVGYLDALFSSTQPKEGTWIERAELVAQARNRSWQLQDASPISRAPYLLELELLKRSAAALLLSFYNCLVYPYASSFTFALLLGII